jgi:hypothetical protein
MFLAGFQEFGLISRFFMDAAKVVESGRIRPFCRRFADILQTFNPKKEIAQRQLPPAEAGGL